MLSHKFGLALAYVRKMTDEKGMVEHAKFGKPSKNEGYTTDDNARAFQGALRTGAELVSQRKIYLGFLQRAVAKEGFHNDMDARGRWVDAPGIGEWYGRAMAAVADGIKTGSSEEKGICGEIWDLAKSAIGRADSPRTMAHLVIAGYSELADKLVLALEENRSKDWTWFEQGLYYDNGRLPLAMFTVYPQIGKETLDFLIRETWDEKKDCFSFAGNVGWRRKGEVRAEFDQQPVEAGSMVEACAAAYAVTKDKRYLEWANKAWEWYDGRNILNERMIDEETGGIRDGFGPQGCSLNEGAEAVLSFVLAGISLSKLS